MTGRKTQKIMRTWKYDRMNGVIVISCRGGKLCKWLVFCVILNPKYSITYINSNLARIIIVLKI